MSCADDVEGVLVEREEDCTNCSMESTWDKFQKQLQNEKESFDYEGTISFTTDKQLTQEQLNQLMDIIALQIIEPVNEEQEDEDYSTRNVEVTVKEVQ